MGVNNRVQDNNYPKPNKSDHQFRHQDEFIEPTAEDIAARNAENQNDHEVSDLSNPLPVKNADTPEEKKSGLSNE